MSLMKRIQKDNSSFANSILTGPLRGFLALDPINCILEKEGQKGSLYLGNIYAACNTDILKKHKIGAVLTVADHADLYYPDLIHRIIKVEDRETENLGKYFEEMAQFIEDNRNKSLNVFVHCFAGVSRSSSAIIAYLMKFYQWPFEKAIEHCKRQRYVVSPNSGFIRQLRNYEKQLRGNVGNKTTSAFKDTSQLRSFSTTGKKIELDRKTYQDRGGQGFGAEGSNRLFFYGGSQEKSANKYQLPSAIKEEQQ